MQITQENIEQIQILTNRLNCILKSLQNENHTNKDVLVLENFAQEIAYNISIETGNIFT